MINRNVLLVLLLSLSIISFSQEETSPKKKFKPEGAAIVKVFANYNSNLGGNEQTEAKEAMQIKRAYFGYKAKVSENYSIKLVMDVGQMKMSDGSKEGKYSAYLKAASLNYKKGKLSYSVGMIGTKQFKTQEKFWGYRYLQKSFQDQYKYNSSADLGLSIAYKLMDGLSVDAIVQNGGGYKHIEPQGTYRGGFGATINIYKPLTFRVYYDMAAKPDVHRQNIATFIGYKFKEKFKIAAEYNYQMNSDFAKDHNMFGYSAYATYIINKKFEVFARYDNSSSNIIEDAAATPNEAWNIKKDEAVALAGVQYKAIKNVKISANYRRTLSAVEGVDGVSWFFLNLEFKL